MSEQHPLGPLERFIEEMGLISQENGGPRIAGRILGLLIVEDEALSLQQISDRLEISRGSASTNARLLARRGLLRLIAKPGDRQDYYQLTSSPEHHLLDDLSVMMRTNAAKIGACAEEVEREAPRAGQRIRGLADFYSRSAEFLEGWAAFLRNEDGAQTGVSGKADEHK